MSRKLAIICSKGNLDMAYPGLILGNSALAEGIDTHLFFTFWGLDIVNKHHMNSLRFTFVGNTAMHMPQAPRAKVPHMLGALPGMTEFATRMMRGQIDDLDVPTDEREEVLIKASILEREVNIDTYLPKVARVIDNRLADPDGETKGFLQMDSPVLYGLGRTGGIPTADELAKDTPYNTYIHKGLPPGPIAQPSVAALEATLRPAEGDWLYFVTVNLDTGETLFADTHAEQEKNRKKLDEYCAANEGKC